MNGKKHEGRERGRKGGRERKECTQRVISKPLTEGPKGIRPQRAMEGL